MPILIYHFGSETLILVGVGTPAMHKHPCPLKLKSQDKNDVRSATSYDGRKLLREIISDLRPWRSLCKTREQFRRSL